MPRVHKYMTRERKGDKPYYKCISCGNDILPGQERYEWEFRYGGPQRQHVSCGYPKRSQLTQSKMVSVYLNVEAIEEAGGWGTTKEEIEANLQSIAETAEEVKSEYEEAAENFGGQGPSQEMAEQLESFISSIESQQRDIADEAPEDGEDADAYIERLHGMADEAMAELP